jgi:hypothetical protein
MHRSTQTKRRTAVGWPNPGNLHQSWQTQPTNFGGVISAVSPPLFFASYPLGLALHLCRPLQHELRPNLYVTEHGR